MSAEVKTEANHLDRVVRALWPGYTRLGYLAVYKFWIVVETPRNRSDIDRNRFVPVCGQSLGICVGGASSGLGLF
jgi:hypothetical protein